MFFPITYRFILPNFALLSTGPTYQALATDADGEMITEAPIPSEPRKSGKSSVYLTTSEKLALFRPLVLRYMAPLCAVYIEEYVINSVSWMTRFSYIHSRADSVGCRTNSGLSPSHSWPVVSTVQVTKGLLPILVFDLYVCLFRSTSQQSDPCADQSFVFLSRSSLSLGVPAIPRRLLPLPSIIQFFVLVLLSLQASRFIFSAPEYTPPTEPPASGVDRSITAVFFLICLEGLCGGSAYVNTFYHVGREGEEGDDEDEEGLKRKMEKEFRIGATGAADSCGQ